jgi:hypothetical protein
MLYLRNTNQQQTLDRGIKRGLTNVCCTPTLNSVTTASLTELTIDSTFGTYLINCKSCVGGYIEVSENSGSSWSIINPGNCSTINLVPQPSQSAYYRLFTSCSANNQPFDPLVSDYSNEILFIPYGIVNYNFIEQPGANGVFKLFDDSELLVNASSSVSGTFWEILSASYATSSIECLSVPLTGSTSMSLLVTGSGVSYYTASCAQSGGIFLDDWKVEPHKFYDVTASLNFRPENVCTASNYTDLKYTVNSYDQTTGIWYGANQYGVYDPSLQYPSASISGSAIKTNAASGDCRFNGIQFSGSMTFNIGNSSWTSVYLAIVTGSFGLSGDNGFGGGWGVTSQYLNTGSAALGFGGGGATGYSYQNETTKNSMVGFALGNYSGPFGRRDVTYIVSGSAISTNPPVTSINWNGNLGSTVTLTGEGIIRGWGYGAVNTVLQSQYNCIYDTTPSK